MSVVVLQPAHAAELASSPLAAGLPADRLAAWTDAPTGDAEHRWGVLGDRGFRGLVRLTPGLRTRLRHVGFLAVLGDAPDGALAEAVRFADDWTPLDRLELALPSHHPARAALPALGFVEEGVRRRPSGPVSTWGRLRPGFVPRPAGPQRVLPPPGHRRADWAARPMRPEDAVAGGRLAVSPGASWGTLQTPSSNDAYYTLRAANPSPTALLLGLWDERTGELAGTGSLHDLGTDHPGLGMLIGDAWQGCGGGRFLLAALLQEARSRGAPRVELAVWDDNARAIALYRAAGFVEEGRRRCDGIRAGGHASSIDMAWSPEP